MSFAAAAAALGSFELTVCAGLGLVPAGVASFRNGDAGFPLGMLGEGEDRTPLATAAALSFTLVMYGGVEDAATCRPE